MHFFSLQKSYIFCQKIKCALFYFIFEFSDMLICHFLSEIFNGKKVGQTKKATF